ncbi:MAG: diadenylate cyclase CdaA [Chthoniobacterales bacterium]|nr:diadenylate cyclase CdaA [Chthoniobacterales bacterium]
MSLYHLFYDHWTSGLEIFILGALLYYIYLFLKKTQGARLLIRVVLIFIVLTFLAQFLHLVVLNWLLRNVSIFLAMALVIIFQPELRRALNEFGLQSLFTSASERHELIEELTNLIFELSRKGFGALIALERDVNLKTWVDTGVPLDALLSTELVMTLFHPKTLLHDGGVIIRGDRILGAGCIFPLSQRDDLDRTLGLRHRAGLGLSEETDAITLIVSEETGHVSICDRGVIKRHLHEKEFRDCLNNLMIREESKTTSP